LARSASTPSFSRTHSGPRLPTRIAKAARFLLPSWVTTLLGTTGPLLAACSGLRLRVAGVTAAEGNGLENPVGRKRDGEEAAAAGAGADAITAVTQPVQSTMKSSSFSSLLRMILRCCWLRLVGSETMCNVNGTCVDLGP